LIIKDPQILNGGQTATTLAMIHEDPNVGSAVFGAKEVLLKIIEKPVKAILVRCSSSLRAFLMQPTNSPGLLKPIVGPTTQSYLNCSATSSTNMACFLSASAVSFSMVLTSRLSRRPAS
jgi:hypothetical protein